MANRLHIDSEKNYESTRDLAERRERRQACPLVRPSPPHREVTEDWKELSIKLGDNTTGYRIIGDFSPESKEPLVVCLHGYSTYRYYYY